MPKILHPGERTLAVAIHGASTACLGGLSPVIWGAFLKSDADGLRSIDGDMFQWFFVSVFVVALVLAPLYAHLPEEKGKPAEPLLAGAILWPLRATTYLVNLIDPRPPRKPSSDGKRGRP